MPVRALTATDTYFEIDVGGRVLHFDYANFPPTTTGSQARVDHIIALAQKFLDTRIDLVDMPADDPAAIADPGLPNFFWEVDGSETTLVAREAVIENVVYDDTKSPPLSFSIRRL